jgi:hypothetical protein
MDAPFLQHKDTSKGIGCKGGYYALSQKFRETSFTASGFTPAQTLCFLTKIPLRRLDMVLDESQTRKPEECQ